MARPRKGVTESRGTFSAALPIAVGSRQRQRQQFSSPDRAQVSAWFAAGELALARGLALPDLADFQVPAATAPAVPAGRTLPLSAKWWVGPTAAEGHDLKKVAHAWAFERYVTLGRAQPERYRDVLATINRDLLPWFGHEKVTTVEGVVHELVAKLAGHLAGQRAAGTVGAPILDPAALWPGLGSQPELTLHEAAKLDGLSLQAVKTWHRAGLLPSWRIDRSGRRPEVRLAVSELRAARTRLLTGPRRTGQAQSTATGKLAILKKILGFARANRVPLTGEPMWDVLAVKPDAHVAITAASRQLKHLPLSVAGQIAAELTVVQQLVFWLERIIGVRIGEAFGPTVGDLIDFGGEDGGCLVLDRQGGRRFLIREEGDEVVANEKHQLKNLVSVRAVRLPRQLMELIRIVIEAFHTDPETGVVDTTARLVPGLQQTGISGQQAHRNALKTALAPAGIDPDIYGGITPHVMRGALITDLTSAGVNAAVARRFVGHAAGADVHDRSYFFDTADLTSQGMAACRPVTDALERLIDAELHGSLMRPTASRDQFGPRNPLRTRSAYVYATLAAHSWFIEPQADDGEALLDADGVATALGTSTTTARRWMRGGPLPGRLVARDRRRVWMCRAEDVETHRVWLLDNPSIDELADQLAMSYHGLYALLRSLALTGSQTAMGGDIRLSPADVATVRAAKDTRALILRDAISLSAAAVELGLPVLVLETLLRRDVLVLDDEATTPRMRYVTRASMAAYISARLTSGATVTADTPAMSDTEARDITGLTRPALADLVTAGVLAAVSRARRRYITTASIDAWATAAGIADVLERLQRREPA